ncbi:O-acetyl-ADP-ribose deacetylase (regulator of RNase III) [Hamadaea flava]|uniref:Histidine kinase n=1 Tax=Hamadaea flava TaxID=1742688 RepID=A0ABV8LLN6_9ACTN|nr:hypothetical protein [Hamadaea flava]MCP2329643.1 O-acetyl-ADP-ribose deacetylase (regulator of RNase III) [Hamadaea flava]
MSAAAFSYTQLLLACAVTAVLFSALTATVIHVLHADVRHARRESAQQLRQAYRLTSLARTAMSSAAGGRRLELAASSAITTLTEPTDAMPNLQQRPRHGTSRP